MNPKLANIEYAIRELGPSHGVVLDGARQSGHVAHRDAFAIPIMLPFQRAVVHVEVAPLYIANSTRALAIIDEDLGCAAAALRGRAIRDMLGDGLAIDFIGADDDAPADMPFERAERLALQLIERGEGLMKAVARARGAR